MLERMREEGGWEGLEQVADKVICHVNMYRMVCFVGGLSP